MDSRIYVQLKEDGCGSTVQSWIEKRELWSVFYCGERIKSIKYISTQKSFNIIVLEAINKILSRKIFQ